LNVFFGTNNSTNTTNPTSPSTKSPDSPDLPCPESPIKRKSLDNNNAKQSLKQQSQLSPSPNATTQEITPTLDKDSCLCVLPIADETSRILSPNTSNSKASLPISFDYDLSLSNDTILCIDSPSSQISLQQQLTVTRRRIHSDYKIKKKSWKKKEIKRLKTAISESTLINYQKNSPLKENKESNKIIKNDGCAIQ